MRLCHKKRRKVSAAVQKETRKQEEAERVKQSECTLAARRTTKQCSYCNRDFLRDFKRVAHESCCKDKQKLSTLERKMSAVNQFQFQLLQGHEQLLTSDSTVLVPIKEVCNRSPATAITGDLNYVPYSVACLVTGLVDTVVHLSGQDREVPLRGWASREANVRPAHRFGEDVVLKLRWCFDQKTRMSAHVIAKYLVEQYGKYAGPSKCLRPAQISGWIQSEVARRKKACIAAAVAAVSTGAVEAAEVVSSDRVKRKNPPNVLVDDLVEAVEVQLTYLKQPEEAIEVFHSRLTVQKTAWRERRPPPPSPRYDPPPAPPPVLKPADPPVRMVAEVVNKRGRRCEWEYECRWIGVPADETTWESADDLSNPHASRAVQAYEDSIRVLVKGPLLCSGFVRPITTQCCNSCVEYDTYDEVKGKCIDTKACVARILQQPRRRRGGK